MSDLDCEMKRTIALLCDYFDVSGLHNWRTVLAIKSGFHHYEFFSSYSGLFSQPRPTFIAVYRQLTNQSVPETTDNPYPPGSIGTPDIHSPKLIPI